MVGNSYSVLYGLHCVAGLSVCVGASFSRSQRFTQEWARLSPASVPASATAAAAAAVAGSDGAEVFRHARSTRCAHAAATTAGDHTPQRRHARQRPADAAARAVHLGRITVHVHPRSPAAADTASLEGRLMFHRPSWEAEEVTATTQPSDESPHDSTRADKDAAALCTR